MLIAALMLSACSTSTTTSISVCAVEVTAAEPTSASAGEDVVLTASPTTTVFDSAVMVGAVRADISDITRTGCESCDSCRSANGCFACGDCDQCDLACEQTCVETVTFTVPTVAAGDQPVQLFNGYGVSDPLTLTVLGKGKDTDTGASDTGGGDDTGKKGGDDTGSSSGSDSGG